MSALRVTANGPFTVFAGIIVRQGESLPDLSRPSVEVRFGPQPATVPVASCSHALRRGRWENHFAGGRWRRLKYCPVCRCYVEEGSGESHRHPSEFVADPAA